LVRIRANRSLYRDRQIYVDASFSPAGAEFKIRDQGSGFNPNDLPDPAELANLHNATGRGLLLVRTFMDSVAFNETGNEVRLTKTVRRVNVEPLA